MLTAKTKDEEHKHNESYVLLLFLTAEAAPLSDLLPPHPDFWSKTIHTIHKVNFSIRNKYSIIIINLTKAASKIHHHIQIMCQMTNRNALRDKFLFPSWSQI